MEADWEVEIGGDALVIDAGWPGFVDLRLAPARAAELSETHSLPVLARTLIRLNAPSSPVWTTKCDVWPLAEFDSDELDAPQETALHAIACYIDLLPITSGQWPSAPQAVEWCKALCVRLRALPLRSCRVDLVLRAAILAPGRTGLGITAYLAACGSTPNNAADTLQAALAIFVDAVAPEAPPAQTASKLQ